MFLDLKTTADTNANKDPIIPGATRVLVFRNYGKTPAIFEAIYAYFQYWTGGVLETTTARFVSSMWISAGEPLMPFPITVTASQAEIDRAKRGDVAIAIIGRLKYRDVFGNSHETGFCWRHDFDANAFMAVDDARLNYHT